MPDITQDLENDFCTCGRHAWRVHCPHCGSYHTYSYTKHDTVTRAAGVIVHLTVYRCRRCAAVFNDDDWKLRCAAPNVALTSRAGRKTADAVPTKVKFDTEEDLPSEMKAALAAIKKSRGLE